MSKPSGEKPAASRNGSALISDARLRELYTTMLKCRMLEERVRQLPARLRKAAAFGSIAGDEAFAVAAAIDLQPGDCVSTPQPDPTASFIQNVPLRQVFAAIHSGRNGHGAVPAQTANAAGVLLPCAPDLQTQLQIATGVALGHTLRKSDNVVVVFLPAGVRVADLSRDVLNFASLQRLPMIFVARESPQPASNAAFSLEAVPSASELPIIPVDGSDVVAVYRVRQEAMSRARRGSGPTVIDCRIATPSASSNGTRARQKLPDPLTGMAAYLGARDLFDQAWASSIAKAFTKELDAALR